MARTELKVIPVSEEDAVYARYAGAAQQLEPTLCCPVEYSRDLLKVIPADVLERDYGCGDPTPYVRSGETVLDLGSGGGKLCFIAAQLVGSSGKIIGIDCNASMMEMAKRAAPIVAERLGFANVQFRFGLIQDLQLDLERLEGELAREPVRGFQSYLKLRNIEESLRREHPLIPNESVDCVLSNCVLNLVRNRDRHQLFGEIFRVLKRGGRAAISDIVADEHVPAHLQNDPNLWSGCISGAFREDELLVAFEQAGFHGMQVVKREQEPWRTVEGIEFRAVTVVAHKGKAGPCLDHNQAIIYRGPFKKVEDDDGHLYYRGERMAVCEKTFQLLQQEPYAGQFIPILPSVPVNGTDAPLFDCRRNARRLPQETKRGNIPPATTENAECGGEACCN